MAEAIRLTVYIISDDPERADELCSTCWLPDVWIVRAWLLYSTGVATFTSQACANCRAKTPLEPQ